MTHKFDAFDNTRNKHYFEFVIPLDIIGNNLTTGSNFPGYIKYHVAAIRTYSIPHNEQQTETVPVPPVKYVDQFVLGGTAESAPLTSPKIYNEYEVAGCANTIEVDGVINADEWGTPSYSSDYADVSFIAASATEFDRSSADDYWRWDSENMYLGYDISLASTVLTTNYVCTDFYMTVGSDEYRIHMELHPDYRIVFQSNTSDVWETDASSVIAKATRPSDNKLMVEIKIPFSRFEAVTGTGFDPNISYIGRLGFLEWVTGGYAHYYDTVSIWNAGDGRAMSHSENPLTLSVADVTDAPVEVTVTDTAVVIPLTGLDGDTEILVAKTTGDAAVANSVVLSVDLDAEDAPTGLVVSHETAMYARDGKITGVTSAMEWRAEGEDTYTTCPDGALENLAPGTYYVRAKSSGNVLASADVEFIIVTGQPVPIAIELDVTSKHKTEYAIGDALDVSGLRVPVRLNDGTTKVVDGTAVTVTGFDSSDIYVAQPLIVTYTENDVTKTLTYNVSIVKEILSQDEQNLMNYAWLMYFVYNQKYEISAAATEGGTITPAGITKVKYNTAQTYTAAANDGYKLKSLIVDGVDLGAITREQVIAILHRFADLMKYESKAGVAGDYTVSDWAEADVAWANANGILTGIGTDISDMTAKATRAEIAAYLARFAKAFVK